MCFQGDLADAAADLDNTGKICTLINSVDLAGDTIEVVPEDFADLRADLDALTDVTTQIQNSQEDITQV